MSRAGDRRAAAERRGVRAGLSNGDWSNAVRPAIPLEYVERLLAQGYEHQHLAERYGRTGDEFTSALCQLKRLRDRERGTTCRQAAA